jgi:hypothetical protein
MKTLRLSNDERSLARGILNRFGLSHLIQDRDIEVLVSWWRELCQKTLENFEITKEEYIEELQIRTALQILADHLPPRASQSILEATAESDEIFLDLKKTNEDFLLDEKLRQKYPKDVYFWLHGIPETVSLIPE